MAKKIFSHNQIQHADIALNRIEETIGAMQAFLTHKPSIGRNTVVPSSGLDVIDWLKRTEKDQGGWVTTCPVTGFITDIASSFSHTLSKVDS